MLAFLALIITAPATPATPASPASPATFDDVDYSFAAERDVVIDGVRLRLLESGPADGPRVLLLHCFGLSSQVWREVSTLQHYEFLGGECPPLLLVALKRFLADQPGVVRACVRLSASSLCAVVRE